MVGYPKGKLIESDYLVGGFNLPLWKIWVRQLGWLFPIYGKIKSKCSKPPFPPFPSVGPDHVMDRGPFSRRLSTVRAQHSIVWCLTNNLHTQPGLCRWERLKRLSSSCHRASTMCGNPVLCQLKCCWVPADRRWSNVRLNHFAKTAADGHAYGLATLTP